MPGINQLGGAQAVNFNTPQPSANEAARVSRVRQKSSAQPASADAVKGAEEIKAASRAANDNTSKIVDRQARRFNSLRSQMKQIDTDRVNLAKGTPTGAIDNTETKRMLEQNRMHNAKTAAKTRAKAKAQQNRIETSTRSAVQETNKEMNQLQRAMKDLFAPRPGGRK